MPGIPAIYYGSEFGIEGKKERGSDVSLRPYLNLNELRNNQNEYFNIIKKLGEIYHNNQELIYGEYKELILTTGKYAFTRGNIIITVNNEDNPTSFDLNIQGKYLALLSNKIINSDNHNLHIDIDNNSGDILIPID